MSLSGKLIVIEGGDASGKATQTEALKQKLEADGHRVETFDFPHYQNTVGGLISECLRGERGDFIALDSRIVSLMFGADRYESKTLFTKWLEEGAVVILDRYTSANMLHQGAKIADEEERKKTVKWIYHLEHEVFGLPIPDAVFYLAIPAEVRAGLQKKEGKKADKAEINLEHQKQVDERADSIFGIYKNTKKIECMRDGQLRTVEDIANEVYNQVHSMISSSWFSDAKAEDLSI